MPISGPQDTENGYIHVMEYYSTVKKNKIMSFAGKWMELEIIVGRKIGQTPKDEYHMFPLTVAANLRCACCSGLFSVAELSEGHHHWTNTQNWGEKEMS